MLGKGASGEAHEADCLKLGKECVAKIYNSIHSFDRNGFLNEVLMLQTVCGGPNIMKIYDVIQEKQGHPVLILEYVHTTEEENDQNYHSLSPVEVQFYMKQLLLAIEYVHKQKVIHRDIKPANVLIDRSRKMIRLIDFGLAMFHNPEHEQQHWYHWWLAPEFLLRIKYDYKADIWSYGAMFASLILRHIPIFSGHNSQGSIESMVKILGSDDLAVYLRSVGRAPNMSEPYFHIQPKAISWKDAALRERGRYSSAYAIPEALDLIHHLLR